MYQELEKKVIKLESENKKLKERVTNLEKAIYKETTKIETVRYKVKAFLGLNIRSGAGTQFYKVGNYKNNEVIEVSNIQGKWAKTDKGFVHLDYLVKI